MAAAALAAVHTAAAYSVDGPATFYKGTGREGEGGFVLGNIESHISTIAIRVVHIFLERYLGGRRGREGYRVLH